MNERKLRAARLSLLAAEDVQLLQEVASMTARTIAVQIISRRCRGCKAPISAPHQWRCSECLTARISRSNPTKKGNPK